MNMLSFHFETVHIPAAASNRLTLKAMEQLARQMSLHAARKPQP
jgi:hypothetical protein